MLRVKVLGAVVVRDEVRVTRGTEGVGLFVPVAGGRGAVDKVATGAEVELGVDVEALQAGDDVAIRARGGGIVAGGGCVGSVCGGGVVLAEGVEEVPKLH